MDRITPLAEPEYRAELASLTAAHFRAALPALLNRCYELVFSVFVFITVFLPSGTIYGVNIKLPLYAALFPLAGYRLLQGRLKPGGIIRLIAIPAVLALWIVVGLIYGFDPAGVLRQYMDIFLTMLLCWLATLFCNGKEERSFQLLRLVLTAEISTSLMKIGLILYALIRGIPVVQVVAAVSVAFGVNLMTMDLGALFGRVQFVSDALIPICIYMVFRYRGRLQYGSWRASGVILLLLLSVLFSFSRYFWAFSLVALLLGLLLGRRDRFQLSVLAALALAVLVSLPALGALYELRFSEQVAGSSDLERVDQSQALQQFFLDAPFLGHGLGSYTNQVIRDTTSPASRYSYEMQILALAGQVGLTGMILLVALILWYYRKLWSNSSQTVADRVGVTVLLLCWFSVGLYNPLLLNPVAGVSYMAIAAFADLRPGKEPTRSAAGEDVDGEASGKGQLKKGTLRTAFAQR